MYFCPTLCRNFIWDICYAVPLRAARAISFHNQINWKYYCPWVTIVQCSQSHGMKINWNSISASFVHIKVTQCCDLLTQWAKLVKHWSPPLISEFNMFLKSNVIFFLLFSIDLHFWGAFSLKNVCQAYTATGHESHVHSAYTHHIRAARCLCMLSKVSILFANSKQMLLWTLVYACNPSFGCNVWTYSLYFH